MTTNIASPIFNTLLTMFFLVIVLGCAIGAFAAIQLAKAQKRYEADEAQMAASGLDYAPAEAVEAPATPDPAAYAVAEPEPEPATAPEGDTAPH